MRTRKMTDKEWLFLLYGYVKAQANPEDETMVNSLEEHLFPQTTTNIQRAAPQFGDEPTAHTEQVGQA